MDDLVSELYRKSQHTLDLILGLQGKEIQRSKRNAILQPIGDFLREIVGVSTQPEVDNLITEMSNVERFLVGKAHTMQQATSFLLNITELSYNSLSVYMTNQNETDLALEQMGNKINFLNIS